MGATSPTRFLDTPWEAQDLGKTDESSGYKINLIDRKESSPARQTQLTPSLIFESLSVR
jgi:hypothetical protein